MHPASKYGISDTTQHGAALLPNACAPACCAGWLYSLDRGLMASTDVATLPETNITIFNLNRSTVDAGEVASAAAQAACNTTLWQAVQANPQLAHVSAAAAALRCPPLRRQAALRPARRPRPPHGAGLPPGRCCFLQSAPPPPPPPPTPTPPHPTTPHHTTPSDYDNRVLTFDRAMRAGLDDVGLGVLYGLYDYRYEVRARAWVGGCVGGGVGEGGKVDAPPSPSPLSTRPPILSPPPRWPGAGHPDARQPPGGAVPRGAAHHQRATHAARRRLGCGGPWWGSW